MHRRRFLASLGASGAVALAGCSASGSDGGDDYDVGMTAVAFQPPDVTVSVGETVRWKNTSSRAHTVTAYESSLPEGAAFFASGGYETESAAREAWRDLEGSITSGESYEHTFEVAGTYEYFCIPHEQAGMVGTVTVEE